MNMIDRVKSIFARDEVPSPAGAHPIHEGTSMTDADTAPREPLEIEISDPGPDTDTCKIVLNRELSPDKTEFFETFSEANGWPMVQRIMRVSGVHSVIVKGSILIVAKHAGAPWASLLKPIEDAIRSADESNADGEASPVDAISAAVAGQGPDEEIRIRVQEILDNEVNPSVAAHGGYISLLDVQGTRVFLHMGGGCQGCGMASATLKHGVETALKNQIPEITEIFDTTDHAAGENPYFQSGP